MRNLRNFSDSKSWSVGILVIILASGFYCCATENPIKIPSRESLSLPDLTEKGGKNEFLFFEIVYYPPKYRPNWSNSTCLWPDYADFPTYYFNKSDRCLYAPPGFYDYIEFNERLLAIGGTVVVGRISGVDEKLIPIYDLPYSFGAISILNITEEGILAIQYNKSDYVEITPGDGWSRQIGECGEVIEIVNYGFLDTDANNRSLKSAEYYGPLV